MIQQYTLEKICKQFVFQGQFKCVEPYGDGHINDTYLVTFEDEDEVIKHYILQRVNHEIFLETEKLMMNIENVTLYLQDIIKEYDFENYEVLALVRTTHDKCYYKHPDGSYWRSYVYVKNATGHTFTEDVRMFEHAGVAFGEFQLLLKDFPVEGLHETIKDFHHTPKRFEALLMAIEENVMNRKESCQDAIDFALERMASADLLISALEQHKIPLRVTHNDTKLNNVLLDNQTLKGRCVIDLDTVMPGSALFDFGDAIRSCGSTVAEDEEHLELLKLDLKRFESYTKGYLSVLRTELTPQEIMWLPDAAILMTLECGVRFLTDYLKGDVYFKTHKSNHNLIRAKNQFKFVEVMEKQYQDMVEVVNRYR
ncbi:MAG: aminoglycoside phosphotransferase family protein [Clostridia bacterium]|nr:aminoglycoside phosphotransferase family protein [Clostridia bacterium]